jgi:hypothetical protein
MNAIFLLEIVQIKQSHEFKKYKKLSQKMTDKQTNKQWTMNVTDDACY